MNIHPLIVHFPIATLVLYGLLEFVSLKKSRAEKFYFTKIFLLAVGVIGTALALQSGEIARDLMGGSELIRIHSLFANITYGIFVGLLIAYLLPIAVDISTKVRWFRIGKILTPFVVLKNMLMRYYIHLVAVVIGMNTLMITGALGGAIVYGPDIDPIVRMTYDIFVPTPSTVATGQEQVVPTN